VIVGVALLVCRVIARRFRIAPPVLLLACGILLGFAPAFRKVHLPPEMVLLLFLPALLYWESITTSLREIRNNLRAIVLLSTALVIATAAAAATAAHALGLPWGPAWVLGAAVAPTDATAVGVLARALAQRRTVRPDRSTGSSSSRRPERGGVHPRTHLRRRRFSGSHLCGLRLARDDSQLRRSQLLRPR
jgi:NhaP-type Na+/H+ or K+/H+ antiporter